VENVFWFPPDKNLPPSQPSLHLLYKLHDQDSLEAMSLKDVEYIEEKVILSSAESNGEFGIEDSLLAMEICDPLGMLLFACQIDGCSQEVCSHILSIPPSFSPSLSKDFLYNTEMGYWMGDSTKYLKSLTKDNFQLALVKTGDPQFANIKSKVLLEHLYTKDLLHQSSVGSCQDWWYPVCQHREQGLEHLSTKDLLHQQIPQFVECFLWRCISISL